MPTEQIFVRVGRYPGAVKEIGLATGSTVGQLLELAELSLSNQEAIEVNGSRGSLQTTLRGGENVSIITNIKGNSVADAWRRLLKAICAL